MKVALLAIATITGVAMILGSASAPVDNRWKRQGATDADFKNSKFECMKLTSTGSELSSHVVSSSDGASKAHGAKAAVPGCQMYQACMEAQGWVLGRDGQFAHAIECVKP